MEFAISLEIGGWALLIVGALVFGVVAQFVGETRTGYEWIVDAIGAGIGALVAASSSWPGRRSNRCGKVWRSFLALIGGLVLGIVVEVVTRYTTGGTYAGRPHAALRVISIGRDRRRAAGLGSSGPWGPRSEESRQ